MMTDEQIDFASRQHSDRPDLPSDSTERGRDFKAGCKFVREIDRQEIDRLKECLRGFVRIKNILRYSDTIDSSYEGEAAAVNNALNEAERLSRL